MGPVRRPWRLVVTGGGTGGHIYPALAIAEAVGAMYGPVDLLYVGADGGMEGPIVRAQEIRFVALPARGLVRKSPLEAAAAVAAYGVAQAAALRLLRGFRPRVVVGTGGYVAAPVCAAAILLRVPLFLQEQNVMPGVTNRWLSRFAATIAVPYPEAARHLPAGARVLLAGNPVRPRIGKVDRAEARARLGLPDRGPVVCCFAGSRGSATFLRLLAGWLPELRGATLLFASGQAHHDAAARAVREWRQRSAASGGPGAEGEGRVVLVPYIDDMADALAAADLVVSRSGGVLAELAAAGMPSILIPSPHVSHHHQEWNAEVFKRAGAAVVLREEGLDGSSLAAAVSGLLARPRDLRAMSAAAAALTPAGEGGALRRIAVRIGELAGVAERDGTRQGQPRRARGGAGRGAGGGPRAGGRGEMVQS